MLFIVGVLIVIGCVMGGYVAAGGHVGVLWQPFEFLIIIGAAIGGFVIGNPGSVIGKTGKSMGLLIKGSPYNKAAYLELLSVMFVVFRTARTKGILALEQHIENPHSSTIFQKFPKFYHNHDAITFMCDYLRLVSLGTTNPHQLEDLMNEELESHHKEVHRVVGAVSSIADGMPALGIVAAVLGVIHTMGSINEPPEILGHLIGAALVGTFSGVLIAYGFIGPMASSLNHTYEAEGRYLHCLKAGLLAYVQGHAPQIAVEFARKGIFHDVRPSFNEAEEALNNAPTE